MKKLVIFFLSFFLCFAGFTKTIIKDSTVIIKTEVMTKDTSNIVAGVKDVQTPQSKNDGKVTVLISVFVISWILLIMTDTVWLK